MDIQLQKKNSVEGTIAIQIQEPDYASLVADKLREYSKKVRIKGFRPGHIPLSLIKKMHGPSIVFETITTLLSDNLSKYLQESKLHIVGEPLPDEETMQNVDWENQRVFEFQYQVGWVPAFQVDLSKDLQVTAYQVNRIAEEAIDEIIENLRKKHGERQEVDQTQVDDVIVGNLTHQQLDSPQKIYLPVVKTKGKAGKSLIDLQVDEAIQIDIKALVEQGIQPMGVTDQRLQELMVLASSFELRVEKIERTLAAELNQTLFDQVLGEQTVDSLEAFRAKLQEYVLRNKQQEADRLLDQAIQKKLLETVHIDLPDDFLKRWLQYKQPKVTSQDVEAYYERHAQELKWELIVQEIVDSNHLSVSADAVIEETKNRFKAAYQMPDHTLDQLVNNFLQENQGENYKRMYQEVVLGKVFDFIKEQITLVYQDLSVEEFNQLK